MVEDEDVAVDQDPQVTTSMQPQLSSTTFRSETVQRTVRGVDGEQLKRTVLGVVVAARLLFLSKASMLFPHQRAWTLEAEADVVVDALLEDEVRREVVVWLPRYNLLRSITDAGIFWTCSGFWKHLRLMIMLMNGLTSGVCFV